MQVTLKDVAKEAGVSIKTVSRVVNDQGEISDAGDIGRLHTIDPVHQILRLVFDERFVDYDCSEADELVHAFAISVHKSQGSEYPAGVTR